MPSTERSLSVAVHDVAPATWPQCQRLLDMLDAYRAPLTLLVVPEFHHAGRIEDDPDFVAAIGARLARGDEVALHGLYHLDDSPPPRRPRDWIERRMLTQSEGEFAALDEARCVERLDRGLSAMRRLGWPVSGFVAPAWLLGEQARAALTRFPLSYTTTRTGIYHLPEWSFTAAPALTYSARSAWRRSMSRALVEAQYAAARSQPLLRIALHPVDAGHEHVVAHWHDLIGRALHERTPLTKAAWIAQARQPAQRAA